MEQDEHNQELDYLFWKEEVLQIMYWLYGEGLDKEISLEKLDSLLKEKSVKLQKHLDQLVLDMYIEPVEKRGTTLYRLTDIGKKEAGRHFAEAFEGLQKAGHGECSPDCDCQWEGHDSCQHQHNH